MKRVGLLLLFSFLVFGVILNSSILLADDNNTGSNNTGTNNSAINNTSGDDDDDDNETEVDDDDENETEIDDDDEEDDDDENKSEIKERTKSREIITRGNCTIKVERSLKIEDGKRVEVIKRKMECLDGTKAEIKIRIENMTEDGRIREKIEYEMEGREIDVDAEDGIDLEEETNATHYKLKARLRNGNVTEIKIMPDQASEIALERLRALNFTIELREKEHKNIPRVVYNIETNKHGRFLGVFKLEMKVDGQVDPVTGEFIGISKPWWAFLVSGEDSEDTDGGQITVALSEQNNSSQSGTAKLVEENGQVTVTFNMTGFTEGVSQPAHIHSGSCPDVGAVKYPLTNVLNGESTTTINVTLGQLKSELPLAINVHQSAENSSVFTACGNIIF